MLLNNGYYSLSNKSHKYYNKVSPNFINFIAFAINYNLGI